MAEFKILITVIDRGFHHASAIAMRELTFKNRSYADDAYDILMSTQFQPERLIEKLYR